MSNQTLGERRVRTSFNPSTNTVVDRLKRISADFIDLLEAMRNDEKSKTYLLSPEVMERESGEVFRLIDQAQINVETACMYAVKAATA